MIYYFWSWNIYHFISNQIFILQVSKIVQLPAPRKEEVLYKSTTGMNTITPELPARHSIIFPIQQRRQFALISLFILILCVEHYDQIILNILTGICTVFFSSCNSVKIIRKGNFVSIYTYVIRNTVIFHTFWIYYTRRGWTFKSINHFWWNRLQSWLNLKARTHYYYNLHKIY